MSPSKREREYARRRYEEYQKRQAEREVVREKRRKQSIAAGISAVAVLVVVVVVWFFLARGNGSGTPSPSAKSTASASGSASAAAAACPKVTTKPVAKPSQWSSPPSGTSAKGKKYTLTFKTSCGDVVLSLDGAKAPKAVASTVFLARKGFYDGTSCHRLTTEGIYVLQCGDPKATGSGGPGYSYGPVENAPKGDLYPAGTVAMARQGNNGNSNGSQFFLVYKDSTIPSDTAGGYTVLGTITSGLDVVKKVAAAGVTGGGGDGAPASPIAIESVTIAAT